MVVTVLAATLTFSPETAERVVDTAFGDSRCCLLPRQMVSVKVQASAGRSRWHQDKITRRDALSGVFAGPWVF